MITKQQLIANNFFKNPNIYIYCPGCEKYTFHSAYSHKGLVDCYEVCLECNCYYDDLELKGN